MERKYRYIVKLTGLEQDFTFNDWDDVQNFIAYAVEGSTGTYTGFIVKREEVI